VNELDNICVILSYYLSSPKPVI